MTRNRAKTDFIVLHCAATRPDEDIGAREIDRRHRSAGLLCNGYHYVIRRNGVVEAGRDEATVGAFDPHRASCVAVCLVGGVAADGQLPFTLEQVRALDTLEADLRSRYPEAKTAYGRSWPTDWRLNDPEGTGAQTPE